MDTGTLFIKVTHPFGDENTAKKRENGEEVMQTFRPLAGRDVLPQQNDVSGLGVRETHFPGNYKSKRPETRRPASKRLPAPWIRTFAVWSAIIYAASAFTFQTFIIPDLRVPTRNVSYEFVRKFIWIFSRMDKRFFLENPFASVIRRERQQRAAPF